MSRIVVFGAGGRAGRRAVAEAASRGHEVTAVVRDVQRHADLGGANVTVVAGDVADAASVAAVADGHDAAVQAAYQGGLEANEFLPKAARALLEGLGRAGVGRLVLVGIGTQLEVSPGVRMHDTPDFPEEYRALSLSHVAELEVLRAARTDLDWLVIVPPPVVLDDEAGPTGRYRIGGESAIEAESFSYADLAVALIDEIENPKHHRALVAIG
ncbi:hypothetical protein LX15_002576 [Streptoalloteichus tenebrarius]|uniref:NAD(P)-binding domain-containing protein n=1 Tax=Streptoalloteichus tenebrarius (strain ATCC 17920 / DSM 40477 / JCM 4838 / CBS 697.72 / NBRC 16177 / NCIMB 11028 / NRRL B-12390 / A12253. 1 / ISP 5477) TaxID=1933 RepID=A0ABT1HTR9_STRSD|nr:NAD(P)H-binding protein [Streptoalloteichus tenebrarius]MCP2258878.1 hypothetical protein [Streptoalloteichus tenebrarius]BFE99438.1 NAD(P)-dependent oxidoreductase [Streptoalloteichus tenebrarius]